MLSTYAKCIKKVPSIIQPTNRVCRIVVECVVDIGQPAGLECADDQHNGGVQRVEQRVGQVQRQNQAHGQRVLVQLVVAAETVVVVVALAEQKLEY